MQVLSLLVLAYDQTEDSRYTYSDAKEAQDDIADLTAVA